MTLVVDTNILITDSTSRTLLRTVDNTLVSPEKLKTELDKYDGFIQKKSGLTESELDLVKTRLFKHVEFVPDEELDRYREQAVKALSHVDPDDVIFLATALAVDGVIWSDDTDFQKQELVDVATTGDILNEFDAIE